MKDYLLEHTAQLTGFTTEFAAAAQEYHDLAEAAGFDYEALWSDSAAEVGPLVDRMKELWIEGNPYYERVEGVVAGTPSLAEYDVILDAGSSAAEDPESAVPFDLTLPDGTVLEQPGNLFNLTEGTFWGTLPEDLGRPSTPVDLDGDGEATFGEVLPEAGFLLSAAQAFDQYAGELDASSNEWQPSDSDAFTALVVMVPTMSEYFGQWKESRFVQGDAATSDSFNVVSRLSDIRDILGGLDIIYGGVQPLVATVDEGQSQPDRAGARRPDRVHRGPVRPGAGGRHLRAGRGRHARRRGAGAGDGDRRAGLAGGSRARDPDRAVGAVRRRAPRIVLSLVALVAAAALAVAAPAAAADTAPPWRLAGELRTLLADAEKTLILDGPEDAVAHVDAARPVAQSLAELVRPAAPAAAGDLLAAVERAAAAAAAGSGVELAVARAEARMAVLAGAYEAVAAATAAGDVASARAWLLVREFRKPTRFSRPGADATLALGALAGGTTTPEAALAAVRADLLDTYQARLNASLEAADQAVERGFATRAASEATLAAGYAGILAPAYREQRGAAAAAGLDAAAQALAAAALAGDETAYEEARASLDEALAGFRAAPLSPEEEERRAGQFLRFLALVPVEYGRGVDDGRVTLDFEVQEAITFRDGAAQAYADLEAALAKRDAAATARIGVVVDELGSALALAARGEQVADPEQVEALAEEALALADGIFPEEWKDTEAADFDVIRTSLDRVEGAVAAGEWGKAEQARLEAYAFFEFGPEQRLRGLAPELFISVEGLFWYGEGDHAGLAQLITRKSAPEEVKATRAALDEALADAEAAVGSGPQSTFSVVTNTAIIVFREGLEAVLILAALTAGMVGAQRRFRRPLLLGAASAPSSRRSRRSSWRRRCSSRSRATARSSRRSSRSSRSPCCS